MVNGDASEAMADDDERWGGRGRGSAIVAIIYKMQKEAAERGSSEIDKQPGEAGEGLMRTSREQCEDGDEQSRAAFWQARHSTARDQVRPSRAAG